jgi:hypothetical protein
MCASNQVELLEPDPVQRYRGVEQRIGERERCYGVVLQHDHADPKAHREGT